MFCFLNSASTSILRPNGSGMVVIRPGNNLYNRPYHTRSTTTAEPPSFVSDNEVIQQTDLVAQSSIATGKVFPFTFKKHHRLTS